MQNLIKIHDVTKNIVRIELTNGKKHNPLSLELMKSLTYSLKEISSRSNVRVLIISSEGPGFSAGHDLEELRRNKNDKEFFKILFNELKLFKNYNGINSTGYCGSLWNCSSCRLPISS